MRIDFLGYQGRICFLILNSCPYTLLAILIYLAFRIVICNENSFRGFFRGQGLHFHALYFCERRILRKKTITIPTSFFNKHAGNTNKRGMKIQEAIISDHFSLRVDVIVVGVVLWSRVPAVAFVRLGSAWWKCSFRKSPERLHSSVIMLLIGLGIVSTVL